MQSLICHVAGLKIQFLSRPIVIKKELSSVEIWSPYPRTTFEVGKTPTATKIISLHPLSDESIQYGYTISLSNERRNDQIMKKKDRKMIPLVHQNCAQLWRTVISQTPDKNA